MLKLKINKTNGITLIALVVTIIVLLLLAGISIQMLTGENGILNRAGQAKVISEEKQAEEELKLGILSLATDYNIGTKMETFRAFIFNNDSKTKLNNELSGTATFDDTNYIITYKGAIYQVEENGDLIKVEGLVLVSNLTLINGVDSTYQLTAQQININTTLTWTSSTPSVAEVDSTGLITVNTTGTTIITAEGTYNGKKYSKSCTVTVSEVTISIEDAEIGIGESKQLTPTVNPSSITEREGFTINWVSGTTSVATVNPTSSTSTIITVPSGAANNSTSTITATAKIGDTTVAIDTCIVKAIKTIGYFKTVNGVAYYYSSPSATGIEITASNMGDYLGMKVNYTPHSKFSDRGTSNIYRLFYVDVGPGTNGKYGDGAGTIYLKADSDSNKVSIDSLNTTNKTDVNVMDIFNQKWAERYYFSNYQNVTYTKYLLDKGIWERYTDTGDLTTAEIANYAVGAPSLEMWIDSYNAFLVKNPVDGYYTCNCTVNRDNTTLIEGTQTYKGPTETNSGYGYYVGSNDVYEGGWNTKINTIVKPLKYTNGTTAKESVKAWNTGSESNSYWLASPSAAGNNYMIMIDAKDSALKYLKGSSSIAFCPLVSCKSEVNIPLAE